ncbi:Reverse transcriptase (RNA-dependent DNA polymerase) [Anaerocolumna jejuensis DSM 15929]|uniref:Reverse transcriptase (RNA-dependent DNA polymerase) n=1 Tax=Anaerocolumna jejuensis DSM 15929 TaxID=1121322 RepID=A0A1M6X1U7_9FIRM|nr:Reverse transcriptase (RNA-dependent DNA polymerase) [Anaerocolumna jejuensis DSM 15929]
MENGIVMDAEGGSPQGGNLSPLLANVYLNEFNKEFQKRGVPFVRYSDDFVLLATSERAAKRLLETSTNIFLTSPYILISMHIVSLPAMLPQQTHEAQ